MELLELLVVVVQDLLDCGQRFAQGGYCVCKQGSQARTVCLQFVTAGHGSFALTLRCCSPKDMDMQGGPLSPTSSTCNTYFMSRFRAAQGSVCAAL